MFEDREDPLDLTGKSAPEDKTVKGLIDDASSAFDSYLEALGARQYARTSKALEKLEKMIERLKKKPVRVDRQSHNTPESVSPETDRN